MLIRVLVAWQSIIDIWKVLCVNVKLDSMTKQEPLIVKGVIIVVKIALDPFLVIA